MKKIFLKLFLCLCLVFLSVLIIPGEKVNAGTGTADDPYIIVLDPGHGGEAEGGVYGDYVEKEINYIVATACKEELSKYEGVVVYLTREGDYDLTLKERAQKAADYNADMLISMHFNKSLNNNLFGTEMWVSAFGDYYVHGRQFAEIQIANMKNEGLFSRGIKTRLYEDKSADYYGIIRETVALDIDAALIEHCHIDNINDAGHFETLDALNHLGVVDATSIAQYLRLKSDSLGNDFTNYQLANIPTPTETVWPDYTDPDVFEVTEVLADTERGKLVYDIKASDVDCRMLFYCYSLDGGETWSDMYGWDEGAESVRLQIDLDSSSELDVVIRAQNEYDLYRDSEVFKYGYFDKTQADKIIKAEEEEKALAEAKAKEEAELLAIQQEAAEKEAAKMSKIEAFLMIALVVAVLVLVSAIVTKVIQDKKKRNRKRKF